MKEENLEFTVKFFLDPFNLFWILLLVSGLFFCFKLDRLFKRVAICTVIWFLLISTPFIPTRLLHSLERQYHPLGEKELSNKGHRLFDIVVLGGGHGYDDRLPENSLLSGQALMRLSEGIRLYHKLPGSRLVLSGYSASGRVPNAEMMARSARLLGFDNENILLQTEPGNTYEEAEFYFEYIASADREVLLVTSAAHMPRAVQMFERFDLEVIASPTHYRLKGDQRYHYFGYPAVKHISHLKTSIYEYAGMVRYLLIPVY